MSELYILFTGDEWATKSSMRPLDVTTDKNTLMTLIGGQILAGNMNYDGEGMEGFLNFKEDYKADRVNFNKLDYGYIQIMDIVLLENPETLPDYAVTASRLLAGKPVTMDNMNLNKRSILFSAVELCVNGFCTEFLMPGIPDQSDVEGSDGYSDFTADIDDSAEIGILVTSYSFGYGESDTPYEDELAFIENHVDEIDKAYGVDNIQKESFMAYYEPEEEY